MAVQSTPIETFRLEIEELLGDIEEAVLDIEQDPDNRETIDRLFRAMHTIKGSGGMFGMDAISDFTHHVETALDCVREGQLSVTEELIDLILASRDHIEALLVEFDSGPPADRANSEDIVSRLQAIIPSAAAIGNHVSPDSARESAGQPHRNTLATFRIRFRPAPGIFTTGLDPVLLLEELMDLGKCAIVAQTEDFPELSEFDPENCYIYWDIVLTTKAGLGAIKDVYIFVEDDSKIDIVEIASEESDDPDSDTPRFGDILIDRGDVSRKDLEDALNEQQRLGQILVNKGLVSEDKVRSALREQQVLQDRKKSAKSESVRVPADKLDMLVNLVGELVITRAQLSQVVATINRYELESPVEEVDRLTAELRDLVLNIRMVPIGTTFTRFRRLVRDLSSELGKEIRLITEGAETEMDKTVVDRLGDPLVHLIRNSIDHGIELPDERRNKGKQTCGTITLRAAHRGAHVVITVADDGQGLDRDIIRAKAIEKKLISPDEKLSDKEIFSQIFAPGFSTAQKVSNISGRGVGMDVVKREIDNLRGTVEIDSSRSRGTTMNLSLPLTLAIIDGLLVKVGDELYVVPLNAVEKCLELNAAAHALSSERNVFQDQGELIPFVRVRDFFGLAGRRPNLEEAVIVSVGDERFALVVDHVIGDHQTVIKSLGKAYENIVGVSGGTIMGDGTVALIIDVAGVLRNTKQDEKIVLSMT
ncbi:MAG: chemotaxis protein CheA [Candidatus Zixiibacteriota bacterium]